MATIIHYGVHIFVGFCAIIFAILIGVVVVLENRQAAREAALQDAQQGETYKTERSNQ